MAKIKKTIKTIKVDVSKCNGCRACEMICSAFHANPKYSTMNPERARIRLFRHPLRDVYLPMYAGPYTAAECMGRETYLIDDKQYDECDFCRAACPSRELFHEPDSGLPLKCDMCEDDPPQKEPLCVKWCPNDALTYEEREEEVEEQVEMADVEEGLTAMVDKYGMEKLKDAFTRMQLKD